MTKLIGEACQFAETVAERRRENKRGEIIRVLPWVLGVLRPVFVHYWRRRYYALEAAVCDGVSPGSSEPLNQVCFLQTGQRSTVTTADSPNAGTRAGAGESSVRSPVVRACGTRRVGEAAWSGG